MIKMLITIIAGLALGSTVRASEDILVDESDVTCEPTDEGGLVCTTPETEHRPGCTRTCGPNGDCTPWHCPIGGGGVIVIKPKGPTGS